jgi:hypothetical protein
MAAMSAAEEADAEQKKNFFPRMAMFFARKKAQNWIASDFLAFVNAQLKHV